jgi:hypothetical protein
MTFNRSIVIEGFVLPVCSFSGFINLLFAVTTEKGIFKTIPNLTMDGTAIKTIARSNPFVLVLENGIIKEKKSLEDFLDK